MVALVANIEACMGPGAYFLGYDAVFLGNINPGAASKDFKVFY
jgi:hypothetical protein